MSLPPLDYVAPRTLKETLKALSDERAVPLAGGTDLIVNLRNSEDPPKNLLLVDLKKVSEFHLIEEEDDHLKIGSLVTLAELASSPLISKFAPALALAAESMGSIQIRNRGTVAGNIVNASPCADLAPPLLIHEASLLLVSQSGRREVPLSKFVKGPYRTDLRRGEVVRLFSIKKMHDGGETFYKLGRREAMNKARMNFAAYISLNGAGKIKEARFSAGSLTPSPMRYKDVETFLEGEKPDPRVFKRAAEMVKNKIFEITGVRWSTPYKAPVSENLTLWVLKEATRIAKGRR